MVIGISDSRILGFAVPDCRMVSVCWSSCDGVHDTTKYVLGITEQEISGSFIDTTRDYKV